MANSSATLATWVAELDPRSIPSEVRARARLLIADALGSALSGTRASSGRLAADFAEAQGGAPEATLIGRNVRIPATNAAFGNAMMGRIDLFDDGNSLIHAHVGVAVIMAALAMAERQDSRADRFVAAIVAGYELTVRVGKAVMPWHVHAGHRPTGTLNCFGATTAASYLLGLDAERTLAAFGLAADQAAGLLEYQENGPIDMSAFHGARPSLSGVMAAMLVPVLPDPLEGRYGFLRVMSPQYDASGLVRGLGEQYAIMSTGLKMYPGNRTLHGSVGAVARLYRANPDFRADNLRSMVVRTHEDAVDECDRPEVRHLLDAQYSIQYNAAVALLRGNVTLADYEPARWSDPATLALMQRIRVEHAPEFDVNYPRLTPYEVVAELSDGKVLRMRLDTPPGSVDNPMTDAEIWAKFEGLAARGLPEDRVRRLREWLETYDDSTQVRTLGPLLAGGKP